MLKQNEYQSEGRYEKDHTGDELHTYQQIKRRR